MTRQRMTHGRFCHRWASWFLVAAGVLLLAGIGRGQEALRLSMAGELAAAQQQQANTTIGYYNLLLGPTAWQFSSGLGLSFDDNVRLQENGESDLIVQPSVNTQMHWPLTLKNSLDVSVGVGYSEYLQHQDLSQFFINPGSGLAFNVYIGDFKINLHDQVSITEYAYQNPGASGANQNLVSLQNTAGVGALWDLNKAVVNAGYDHANYLSLSQNLGEPDASSENLYGNAALRVRPELLLGVEAGGTLITYDNSTAAYAAISPNATQWSAGFMGSDQISDYMSIRADAGYTVYTPDNTSSNLLTSDTSGFYLSLSFSHQVNRFLSYTLSAGRSTDLAAYGQAQSYYFVRLNPVWNLFKNYGLSTPFWWQQGTLLYNYQAGGIADYQQIGLGVTISRQVTQKLSASVGYQFVDETSNQAGLAYTVNIVDLNLTYRF